jgi:Dual-action HEIGH metallo-peptidase
MKKILFGIAGALLLSFAISCQKSEKETPADNNGVPDAIKAKITALGLTAAGAYKTEGGYIAEGDIFLDDATLNSTPEQKFLVVAGEEHYRTTNLVGFLPRTLRVRYAGTNAAISTAINNAINRYNAEPLLIKFLRVTSSPNITVYDVSGVPYIASAGFPSGGNPYSQILFNVGYSWLAPNTLTTVMAHEMGHCIGFRHTDYACRQYSCGGSPVNEGSAGVGAIHIPGTPTACNGDPTSWMLACIGNGVNRPFNANDKAALNYLY